jgi:hypothetical protein
METVEEAEERALYPQAMAQAGQASSIMLEGQEEGGPQHDKMGVYTLMEGKEANRRGGGGRRLEEGRSCSYTTPAPSSGAYATRRIWREGGHRTGWQSLAPPSLRK